jgi:hypothetical protein
MTRITRRIGNPHTKHLYDVEVLTKEGARETWEIDANNRAQASKVAEKEGAQVRSVNMVG